MAKPHYSKLRPDLLHEADVWAIFTHDAAILQVCKTTSCNYLPCNESDMVRHMHLHMQYDLVRRGGWTLTQVIRAMYYRQREYCKRYCPPVPEIEFESDSESGSDQENLSETSESTLDDSTLSMKDTIEE